MTIIILRLALEGAIEGNEEAIVPGAYFKEDGVGVDEASSAIVNTEIRIK